MICNNSFLEDQFDERFEIIKADTDELLNTCKKIRYNVFCEERNIFDPTAHNNFLEEDHYDTHAVQALIRDKTNYEFVATARLVLSNDRKDSFNYPLEEWVTTNNHSATEILRSIKKENTAEVSRFSISKKYRNLPKRTENNPKNSDSEDAMMSYLILIGLMKATTEMSAEHNISNWLAFLEPSFLRLLSRFGIKFDTHGPMINHYGKRYACERPLAELLNGVKQTKPDAWRLITGNGKVNIH